MYPFDHVQRTSPVQLFRSAKLTNCYDLLREKGRLGEDGSMKKIYFYHDKIDVKVFSTKFNVHVVVSMRDINTERIALQYCDITPYMQQATSRPYRLLHYVYIRAMF